MGKRVFISTGEVSGDIHAANMLKELKSMVGDIEIHAIGGDRLQEAGANLLFHIKDISVMGFLEVVRKFRYIRNVWNETRDFILRRRPDVVVVVDYPGFNLRLAKFCYQHGIPVIYYIAPQLWAWGSSRVKVIERTVREVICIFPFEVEWFRNYNIKATYTGHPIFDQIDYSSFGEANKKRNYDEFTIGLLPGSRQQEVKHHLPIMIDALRILRDRDIGLKAVIAVAPNIGSDMWGYLSGEPWIRLVRDNAHEVVRSSDIVVVSSGTATLETTAFAKPMVVCYRLSFFSYIMGRTLVKVRHIAIPNLLAGERVVPELIQYRFNPENLAEEILKYIENIAYRESISKKLRKIASTLYREAPGKKAAEVIARYLRNET